MKGGSWVIELNVLKQLAGHFDLLRWTTNFVLWREGDWLSIVEFFSGVGMEAS